MRASDVLVRALEFWGQGGEQWIQTTLGDYSGACLVGGISMAALGRPEYLDAIEAVAQGGRISIAGVTPYKQAMKYVWDELNARGLITSNLECGKTSLQHESALIRYNDSIAKSYGDVKSVVCGAVKRALADEECVEVNQ